MHAVPALATSIDDDVTAADDGETSLEAELESLPAAESGVTGVTAAEQRDDDAEQELEQIGKLLRNTNEQSKQ